VAGEQADGDGCTDDHQHVDRERDDARPRAGDGACEAGAGIQRCR
jgi:hypothetical protein